MSATHHHTERMNLEWLLVKLALPAQVDFGDLMAVILEQWSAADDCVTQLDLDTNTECERPTEAIYRDPHRRDMTLHGPQFGSLNVLRYDAKRPGDKTRASFYLRECLVVNLRHHFESPDFDIAAAAIRSAYQLALLLNDAFGLEAGYLRRADRFSLSPSPPLAPCNAILQIIDPDQVGQHYDDTDLYWSVWDERNTLANGRVMVTRAIDCTGSFEFQQSIFSHQWSLARTVISANTTGFGELFQSLSSSSFPKDYQAFLDREESALSGFHYHEANQILDVSAWTEPGTFISAREIAQLLSWRLNQQYDDRHPVREIRVTFPTLEQARAQMPVLRDIGCQVYYVNPETAQPVEFES